MRKGAFKERKGQEQPFLSDQKALKHENRARIFSSRHAGGELANASEGRASAPVPNGRRMLRWSRGGFKMYKAVGRRLSLPL
jgi:hypothetical protein